MLLYERMERPIVTATRCGAYRIEGGWETHRESASGCIELPHEWKRRFRFESNHVMLTVLPTAVEGFGQGVGARISWSVISPKRLSNGRSV